MQLNQPKEEMGPRIVPNRPSEAVLSDDAVVETPLTVPSHDGVGAPEQPVKAGGSGDIPTILLVQAGLTVFNAAIVLIYVVVWMIDITLLAAALRVGAGFALLLALAPMALGVYIERKNRRENTKPPGLIWAHVGVYAGAIMCTLTLMIPLVVTVRSVVNGQ